MQGCVYGGGLWQVKKKILSNLELINFDTTVGKLTY